MCLCICCCCQNRRLEVSMGKKHKPFILSEVNVPSEWYLNWALKVKKNMHTVQLLILFNQHFSLQIIFCDPLYKGIHVLGSSLYSLSTSYSSSSFISFSTPYSSPPPLWCPWPLPSRLSGFIVSNQNSFSQSLWCISRIILTVIFAKKYVHFSKQFVQTTPRNGFPAKPVTYSKLLVHLSKVSICQWTYQCLQNEKSLCCYCSQTRCLVMLSI